MQKILIHNFGPLKDIELYINDMMLFIGPQATGKSTLSKSIYFFKSLRDDLIRYYLDSFETKEFEKPLGTFGKKIRHKFIEFWGPTFHLTDVFLKYYYTDEIWISIKLEERNKYVTPNFSDQFRYEFRNILDSTKKYVEQRSKRNIAFLTTKELIEFESTKKSIINIIEKQVNNLFNESKDILFIPAGRSLLATLSDHLQAFDPKKLDYLMRAFVDRISNTKLLFNKSISDLVKERILLTTESVINENVKLAEQIIQKILKGKYKFDDEGEKIYIDNKRYTKLSFSSSGQQESIWILLLTFLYILENRKVFIVIEEPEAHLYPSAQKDIIELLALLFNITGNQIIITTHSPYIISSVNNLLYAGKLGKKNKNIEAILNKKLWIDNSKLSAYKMINGKIENIVDDELNLIKVEEIDIASSEINSEFDKLFDLDN